MIQYHGKHTILYTQLSGTLTGVLEVAHDAHLGENEVPLTLVEIRHPQAERPDCAENGRWHTSRSEERRVLVRGECEACERVEEKLHTLVRESVVCVLEGDVCWRV